MTDVVHSLVSRDAKTIRARCGYTTDAAVNARLPAVFTAWPSKVTCPDCKPESASELTELS